MKIFMLKIDRERKTKVQKHKNDWGNNNNSDIEMQCVSAAVAVCYFCSSAVIVIS